MKNSRISTNNSSSANILTPDNYANNSSARILTPNNYANNSSAQILTPDNYTNNNSSANITQLDNNSNVTRNVNQTENLSKESFEKYLISDIVIGDVIGSGQFGMVNYKII